MIKIGELIWKRSELLFDIEECIKVIEETIFELKVENVPGIY